MENKRKPKLRQKGVLTVIPLWQHNLKLEILTELASIHIEFFFQGDWAK